MKLRNITRKLGLAATFLGIFAGAACGSGDDADSGFSGKDSFPGADPSMTGSAGGNSGPKNSIAVTGRGTGGNLSALPAEKELETNFEAPVVTGKFLWSANPTSSRIALVDAGTYQVETRSAGSGPTYVARVPSAAGGDADRAIVLNVLSQDATLLSPSGVSEAFPTQAGANAWAVSPKGRWALAWTDARLKGKVEATEGFQDATLILAQPLASEQGVPRSTRHGRLGFRPSSVTFDASETHAYVITSDGISVFDLSDPRAPTVSGLISVGDSLDEPTKREVVISPDGALALIRRQDQPTLGVIELATGARAELTLPGNVTDLDVTGSVATGQAVAVLRDTSSVVVVPLSEVLKETPSLGVVKLDGVFGSVSLAGNGSMALAYTNATASDRVAIIDLRPGDTYLNHRVDTVKAPVQAVMVAEDGQHAIALLGKAAGSTTPGAFAVLSTTRKLAPRIVSTDAALQSVAIAPGTDGRTALVSVRDDTKKVYGVYAVELPTLQVDRVPLSSPPLSLGLIPTLSKGYVAQLHSEGRITFLEFPDPAQLATGTAPTPLARTLTGFELAAKVIYPAK